MHLTDLLLSLYISPDQQVLSLNLKDSPLAVFIILYVLTNCPHSEIQLSN